LAPVSVAPPTMATVATGASAGVAAQLPSPTLHINASFMAARKRWKREVLQHPCQEAFEPLPQSVVPKRWKRDVLQQPSQEVLLAMQAMRRLHEVAMRLLREAEHLGPDAGQAKLAEHKGMMRQLNQWDQVHQRKEPPQEVLDPRCLVCLDNITQLGHIAQHVCSRRSSSSSSSSSRNASRGAQCGPFPICLPCGRALSKKANGQLRCPVCKKNLGPLQRALQEGRDIFKHEGSKRRMSFKGRELKRLSLKALPEHRKKRVSPKVIAAASASGHAAASEKEPCMQLCPPKIEASIEKELAMQPLLPHTEKTPECIRYRCTRKIAPRTTFRNREIQRCRGHKALYEKEDYASG